MKNIGEKKNKTISADSLAVKTYQINTNFPKMRDKLKLLDSSYNLWNNFKNSKIRVRNFTFSTLK